MEENFKWLWYAFSLAWVLVVGYLFSLGRGESKLRDELESLKTMIEDRQKK